MSGKKRVWVFFAFSLVGLGGCFDDMMRPLPSAGPGATDMGTSTGISGSDDARTTGESDGGHATTFGDPPPDDDDGWGSSSESGEPADEGSSGALCEFPLAECDGECVKLGTPQACNGCGHVCEEGDACDASECTGSRELVDNGGFDDGLDGWETANNPVGSIDTAVVYLADDGYASPGTAVQPAARVLYQDIEVPEGVVSATFSVAYGIAALGDVDPHNVQVIEADPFDEQPGRRDAARIDIVDPDEDVFYATILEEVWLPPDSFGEFDDPTDVVEVDVTELLQAHEGETIRLRFGHVESTVVIFNGLDDVSLEVDVTY